MNVIIESMTKLINFHNNSEYSFLESTITIDKLINNAIANDQKYLVLTDHNNMFGVPTFLEKTRVHNIKPIVGLDLDVENFRLILIAKNYEGFLELSRLSNLKMSGQEILHTKINCSNILLIDHPRLGYFAQTGKQLFLDNYFVISRDPALANAIWVQEHMVNEEKENEYLSIMHSIVHGQSAFFDYRDINYQPDLPSEIVERTNALVHQIDLQFPTNRNPLPKYPNDLGLDSYEFLQVVLKKAIVEKETEMRKYLNFKTRLLFELDVIKKLGFADYFLIIWDFIKWAKENNITIGPGRGSSAGSLICYLLDITEVNPLKYNLLFERFLNPQRVSMPDIDIDIQDNRRDEVIEYIIAKYGNEKVASIVTFQTLGAKMALRDVARVLKISLGEVNEITKMLPMIATLENSYQKISKFKAKIDSKPIYQTLYKIAAFLSGLPRQQGTHAAGIIVSDSDINKVIPTMMLKNGRNQTQFSMDFLEDFGLLKIDLLGLKNLTTISDILKTINQRHGTNLKMQDIPLNHVKTNALLSNGKTIGIFQLESPGMINTLRRVHVDRFEDLPAIISLFRPGPMQNITLYTRYKNNQEKPPFISQEYNHILESTYGIIVYQEQIMEICQKIAKMDFAHADILRKAISKKDFSEIAPIKESFFKGALDNGYSQSMVEKIFSMIEKFAEYGFNKSHAFSYAILSYRMAYLKTEYPLEFFASVINSAAGNHTTIEKFFVEAKSMGFRVESPTINHSSFECSIGKNSLLLPLIMIKGFGEVAVKKVLEERCTNGLFVSFEDFVVRAKKIALGESNIKLLLEANVLREFGNIKTLENALETKVDAYANIITSKGKVNSSVQVDFSLLPKPQYPILALDVEYERKLEEKFLGFSYNHFISNPFEIDIKLVDLEANGPRYVLAVVVSKIEIFNDKRGRQMARLLLSDSSKTIKVIIFSSRWAKFQELQQGRIVSFKIGFNGTDYTIDNEWKFKN